MSYCTEQDVKQGIGFAYINTTNYNISQYIARADARINSALRNYFEIPLISGSVNDDTWNYISSLSASFASALLLMDMSAVQQNSQVSAGAKEKLKMVLGDLDKIEKGEIILAGATKRDDGTDEAIVPRVLVSGPDKNTYFANRDEYNIDRDARNGVVQPENPIDPDTGLELSSW